MRFKYVRPAFGYPIPCSKICASLYSTSAIEPQDGVAEPLFLTGEESFYLAGKLERAARRAASKHRRRTTLAGRHIVGIGGLAAVVVATVAMAVLVF